MTNRLAHETSPYLLQHARNPVDWYPWGREALELAQREQRPIFLSIGYSACHWCHVMEHESFENPAIAARLNELFVCIKVDREERPDLDQIYMNAVQVISGHGGWPMSVFLTPDLKPFFGGTYWPPDARQGMPGFRQVIEAVADAWLRRREQAVEQAEELTNHLRELGVPEESSRTPQAEWLVQAAMKLEQVFDFAHGGFGRAPKFPHSVDLQLLLRVWKRTGRGGWLDMVRLNLDKMARGGIYDQLGGGFARYSVDERWLVPHFEKMLYDNGLLVGVYLDAYLATGDSEYSRIVRESSDYVLRDLLDKTGGFHSAEDADSEGVEGKFYVWTPAEIEAALGREAAARFAYVYDVTPQGNFEHQNILNLPKTVDQCASLRGWDRPSLEAELAESRTKLMAVRNQRVRPGKDDKILVAWNALMIDSMARAGAVLECDRYVAAACRAGEFLRRELRTADGRLWHTWRLGQAKLMAYLDDYAYCLQAFVSLYESTFDETWLDTAVEFAEILKRDFWDDERGGYFFTAVDHEQLIARNKDYYDNSVPSGNAMAATGLLRLAALTGKQELRAQAEATIQSSAAVLERAPTAAGQMLVALDWLMGPVTELVIVAPPGHPGLSEVLRAVRSSYRPNWVLAVRTLDDSRHRSRHLDPLFTGREAVQDLTAYVCRDSVCQSPLVGTAAILSAIREWVRQADPI